MLSRCCARCFYWSNHFGIPYHRYSINCNIPPLSGMFFHSENAGNPFSESFRCNPCARPPQALYSAQLTAKAGVGAILFEQFFVRPAFRNFSVGHHDDPVSPTNGRKAVCNCKNCLFSGKRFDRLLNLQLGFVIHRAGGFVQNQYRSTP